MNPKSKGYGNLGRGIPKDLAKAHGVKWADDVQGKEMGRGCPKG